MKVCARACVSFLWGGCELDLLRHFSLARFGGRDLNLAEVWVERVILIVATSCVCYFLGTD